MRLLSLIFLLLSAWIYSQELTSYGFPFSNNSDLILKAKIACVDLNISLNSGIPFSKDIDLSFAFSGKDSSIQSKIDSLLVLKNLNTLNIISYPCDEVANARAFYNQDQSFILWNREFFSNLSFENGIWGIAVLAHEIGHIIRKHKADVDDFNYCKDNCKSSKKCSLEYEKFRRMEYEADVYAGYTMGEMGINSESEVLRIYNELLLKNQVHQFYNSCASHPDIQARRLAIIEGFILYNNHKDSRLNNQDRFTDLSLMTSQDIKYLDYNRNFKKVMRLFMGQNIQITDFNYYLSYGKDGKDNYEEIKDDKGNYEKFQVSPYHHWANANSESGLNNYSNQFRPTFSGVLDETNLLTIYLIKDGVEEVYYRDLLNSSFDYTELLDKIKSLYFEFYKSKIDELKGKRIIPSNPSEYALSTGATSRIGEQLEFWQKKEDDPRMILLGIMNFGSSGGYVYDDGQFFLGGANTCCYDEKIINQINKKYSTDFIVTMYYSNGFFGNDDLKVSEKELYVTSWVKDDFIFFQRSDTNEIFFKTQFRLSETVFESYKNKIIEIYLEAMEKKLKK